MKKQIFSSLLILSLFALSINAFSQCQWVPNNTTNSGLLMNNLSAIATDTSGNIWFGYENYNVAMISKFKPPQWNNIPLDTGFSQVSDMDVDAYGNIWVAAMGGVCKLSGTTWTNYTDANGLADLWIKVIAVNPFNGEVWAGTENGVSRFNGTTWTNYNDTTGMVCTNVSGIDFGLNNKVYITSYSNGYSCFGGVSVYDRNTGLWDSLTVNTTGGGLPSNEVKSVAVDHNGRIWFGTDQGVSKFDGATFTNYTSQNSGLMYSFVKDIAIDQRKNIWFATDSGASMLKHSGNLLVMPLNPVGGFFPPNSIKVSLYTYPEYELFASQVNGPQPNIMFFDIPARDYIVKAGILNNGSFPNLLSAYYDSVTTWADATPVSVPFCGNGSVQLSLMQVTPPANGIGTISGNIFYTTNKSILGEPVPGAEVTLEQEPDDDPIACTLTDSTGYFEFTEVVPATGSFQLTVDIPGYTQLTTYTDISIQDTASDFNFYVNTSSQSISMGAGELSEFTNENFSVQVYPNPYSESLYIGYELKKTSFVNIEVYDLTGKIVSTITRRNQPEGNYRFPLFENSTGLPGGTYFVKIQVDKTVYSRQIIGTR